MPGKRAFIFQGALKIAAVVLGLLPHSVSAGVPDGRRVALVIGNANYVPPLARLTNPGNDAKAVAKAFETIGFDTTLLLIDVNTPRMLSSLSEFARTASDAEIAVVFYAGHGVEHLGQNYLMPLDAAASPAREEFSVASVLKTLAQAKRLRLVILDACRTSPYADQPPTATGGLARPTDEASLTDTLIAYAAAEGTVAYDGPGSNSPFTTALLSHLGTPGLDVTFVLRRARDDVMQATQRKQQPHFYGSMTGDVVSLNPVKPVVAPPAGVVLIQARYERLVGDREPASDTYWGSAWLDLKSPRAFRKGERLLITLADDNAKYVLVRLLQDGERHDQPAGIVGGRSPISFLVPSSRIVEVTLDRDYPRTIHISVHGGPRAWHVNLGPDNGPVRLLAIDLVP